MKWTTPIHVLLGIFSGILFNWYPGLSVSLMAGFGIFEYWEAKRIHDNGHKDFWEGLLGYFIGAAILLILKLTGVV